MTYNTDTPRPEYEIEIDTPVLTDGQKLPVTLRKPGFFGMLRLSGAMPEFVEEMGGDIEATDLNQMDVEESEKTITFMEVLITQTTDIPEDVVGELSVSTMEVLVEACVAVINDDDPRRLEAVDGRPDDAPAFDVTETELLKN